MDQSKVLSASRVKQLLDDTKGVNRNKAEPAKWPGDVNMLRLARAVDGGHAKVGFTGGKFFDIKYNKDNVRVKPSNGQFAPMGFISYKSLKEAKETDAANK